MKLKLVVALALISANTYANEFKMEQRPYQQPTIVPAWSSPFSPQDTIPAECKDPIVEKYIADWEAGKVNFNTIKPNNSIAKKQRFCKTMDDNGNIKEAKDCKLSNAPVGYIWKELSDGPVVIGITNGKKSDHQPHFHGQPECYYAIIGEAKTLADGKYQTMKKGQYFYIPGNSIHNTPIFSDKGFGVMYWYPKNAHFDGFKYYWLKDVKYLIPAEQAFEKVDEIRKRDLNLGPYGTNKDVFK